MVYSLKNVHRDDSMPASRNAVVGMNNSDDIKLSKSTSGRKLPEEEAVFDSGILSGSDFSQTYSGEVDSVYGLSTEYDSGSELRTPSSLSRRYNVSEQLDFEEQPMGLSGLNITDSGVYTDVSERLYQDCSKECSHDDTKSVSATSEGASSRSKAESSPSREQILYEIFAQDEDGDTQLHIAIIRNDLRTVYEIMRIVPHADYVNIRNYDLQTCLHLSVLMNMAKITRLLLLAGARTDMEDRNGNTALHLACKRNNLACVMALLSPLNAYEEKYIVFRYKPIIARSVDDLNEYNYDGLSCLHLAAEHEDRQILGQLLMYGADVNISECKGGYTLLHEAVQSGDVKLVDYILQHPGIDVNRKNYARRTAYQLASRHPNIRQLLLKSGSQYYSSEDDDDEDDSYSEESDDDDAYLVYSAV